MSAALARKPARAQRRKNRKAKGKGRKKPSKSKSREKDDVLLDEERYTYTGTFKPKKDET